MPATEATPFTVREQLERDMKRALESTMTPMLEEYRPYRKFNPKFHVTRSIENRVGEVRVRVRIEVSGEDVNADWIVERG